MRFFVKVKFRERGTNKIFKRVYMCPTEKARQAIHAHFKTTAATTQRGWLTTEFGRQLEPFGREYWGAVEPRGIPEEIQKEHPGIMRVVRCKKGDAHPNIDNMPKGSNFNPWLPG